MNRPDQVGTCELPIMRGALLREYALHMARRFNLYSTLTPSVGRTRERSEQSAANSRKHDHQVLHESALWQLWRSREMHP